MGFCDYCLKFGASTFIIKWINVLALFISLGILGVGIWLATKHGDCERFLLLPVVVIGAGTFFISFLGFMGAWKAIPLFLWIYLIILTGALALLALFTIFAFVITTDGSGHVASGNLMGSIVGFKEYYIGDFSSVLQDALNKTENWKHVEDCLLKGGYCNSLNRFASIVDLAKGESAVESGCCRPPVECGFPLIDVTTYDLSNQSHLVMATETFQILPNCAGSVNFPLYNHSLPSTITKAPVLGRVGKKSGRLKSRAEYSAHVNSTRDSVVQPPLTASQSHYGRLRLKAAYFASVNGTGGSVVQPPPAASQSRFRISASNVSNTSSSSVCIISESHLDVGDASDSSSSTFSASDCSEYSNAADTRCFSCMGCKAGVAQYIKKDWRLVANINIAFFVFLLALYIVGCFARHNASRAQYTKMVRGGLENIQQEQQTLCRKILNCGVCWRCCCCCCCASEVPEEMATPESCRKKLCRRGKKSDLPDGSTTCCWCSPCSRCCRKKHRRPNPELICFGEEVLLAEELDPTIIYDLKKAAQDHDEVAYRRDDELTTLDYVEAGWPVNKRRPGLFPCICPGNMNDDDTKRKGKAKSCCSSPCRSPCRKTVTFRKQAVVEDDILTARLSGTSSGTLVWDKPPPTYKGNFAKKNSQIEILRTSFHLNQLHTNTVYDDQLTHNVQEDPPITNEYDDPSNPAPEALPEPEDPGAEDVAEPDASTKAIPSTDFLGNPVGAAALDDHSKRRQTVGYDDTYGHPEGHDDIKVALSGFMGPNQALPKPSDSEDDDFDFDSNTRPGWDRPDEPGNHGQKFNGNTRAGWVQTAGSDIVDPRFSDPRFQWKKDDSRHFHNVKDEIFMSREQNFQKVEEDVNRLGLIHDKLDVLQQQLIQKEQLLFLEDKLKAQGQLERKKEELALEKEHLELLRHTLEEKSHLERKKEEIFAEKEQIEILRQTLTEQGELQKRKEQLVLEKEQLEVLRDTLTHAERSDLETKKAQLALQLENKKKNIDFEKQQLEKLRENILSKEKLQVDKPDGVALDGVLEELRGLRASLSTKEKSLVQKKREELFLEKQHLAVLQETLNDRWDIDKNRGDLAVGNEKSREWREKLARSPITQIPGKSPTRGLDDDEWEWESYDSNDPYDSEYSYDELENSFDALPKVGSPNNIPRKVAPLTAFSPKDLPPETKGKEAQVSPLKDELFEVDDVRLPEDEILAVNDQKQEELFDIADVGHPEDGVLANSEQQQDEFFDVDDVRPPDNADQSGEWAPPKWLEEPDKPEKGIDDQYMQRRRLSTDIARSSSKIMNALQGFAEERKRFMTEGRGLGGRGERQSILLGMEETGEQSEEYDDLEDKKPESSDSKKAADVRARNSVSSYNFDPPKKRHIRGDEAETYRRKTSLFTYQPPEPGGPQSGGDMFSFERPSRAAANFLEDPLDKADKLKFKHNEDTRDILRVAADLRASHGGPSGLNIEVRDDRFQPSLPKAATSSRLNFAGPNSGGLQELTKKLKDVELVDLKRRLREKKNLLVELEKAKAERLRVQLEKAKAESSKSKDKKR